MFFLSILVLTNYLKLALSFHALRNCRIVSDVQKEAILDLHFYPSLVQGQIPIIFSLKKICDIISSILSYSWIAETT